MKKINKIATVVLSAAMLVTQAMPVFASSIDPTDGTSTGTASILAYNVEKVVVPTTLKVALNPNGYAVNIRYSKVADTTGTPVADTQYYTYADGKYVKQVKPLTAFAASTDYYTAETDNSKVISLKYGIANKSTRDKDVKVDIAVKQDTSTTNGKTPIIIVDSVEKAQAYNATSNADGAKLDEMKMYLGLIASKDLPTANTYAREKTFGTATTIYYQLTADKKDYELVGTDGKLADAAAFAGALAAAPDKKLFTASTAIGTEIRASELSDVGFTDAEAGEEAFTAGTENKANAAIGYKLTKATYAIADDYYLDFDDTQATIADKIELSALTGVAGFTIIGDMNQNVDWTRADAVALKLVPTYTISDSTGDEEFVDSTKAYNQIKLADEGPSIASNTFSLTADTALDIVYNLGRGELAATKVEGVFWSGASTVELIGADMVTDDAAGCKLTLTAACVNNIIAADNPTDTLTVKFDKGDDVVVSLTH